MSTDRVFGPIAPSRLALMGIRFIEGEDGGAPAETPSPKPAEPAQDTTDWKAEARKWESRSKENSTAAQRLAEIEEEKKTDEQRVTDRIAVAEKRAAELEAKAAASEVAESKSVPSALLAGPASNSAEDLAAFADALIAFKGTQPAAEPKADKKTYFVPDEGGVPALGKQENITPGMGSLRAGYAQEKE